MATNVSHTQSSLLWRQMKIKSNSWKWQLVWLFVPTVPSNSALLVMCSLPILLWKVLCVITNSAAAASGTKYPSSSVQAASTKPEIVLIVLANTFLLAAPRSSLCAHRLVQFFTHNLNPRGLHKCINIAQISSALYMQNTCIISSPNTLFSHEIVLSPGRTWQMNLLSNDLRMKWHLTNCGLYT